MTRIAVIEDEVIIAQSILLDIKDCGYTAVGAAADAEEAMKLISEQHPDIVLSDINLRRSMDGIELAKWINNFDQRIVVVFMTGFGSEIVENRLSNIVYHSLHEKPVDIPRLLKDVCCQ